MIPKVIHYCWFGYNPIPKEYYSYMQSWQEKCPDYKIQRWDESNFDVDQNLYCKQAYARKKWAFVSDYARLKIIYEHGGIYLDTDVEVIKRGKCGKDRKNAVGGHWTERSEGSGWSEAEFWIACFLRSKKPPK